MYNKKTTMSSVVFIVMVFEIATQKTYRLNNRNKTTMTSIENHQVLYGSEALAMGGDRKWVVGYVGGARWVRWWKGGRKVGGVDRLEE
jgi:hypothetical protein